MMSVTSTSGLQRAHRVHDLRAVGHCLDQFDVRRFGKIVCQKPQYVEIIVGEHDANFLHAVRFLSDS